MHEGLEKVGDPEMPLHKSVKVKPGMQWRPQDSEDARAMRFLARRGAYREWNQPKREMMLHAAKLEGQDHQRSLILKSETRLMSL